ncbi:MAG: DUF1648 domain-containing protein [Actinomycetota bacterium]|nr:DUF1648 domain-containing protein [Actinomycetota bacterium]
MTRFNRTSAVIAAVAIAVFAPVPAIAPLIMWSSRLPDPIATHWTFGGEANDSMSSVAFALLIGGFMLLGGAALVAGVARAGTRAAWPPVATFLGIYFVTMFAALGVHTAAVNLDHDTWTDVAGPSVGVVLAITIVPLVLGALAARLVSTRWPAPAPDLPSGAGTQLPVDDGERVVWIGRCANPLLLALSAGLVALGVATAMVTAWWIGAILVVSGIVSAPLGAVTVVVDPGGLKVRYGLFGWPVTRIAADRVRASTAIDVEPSRWGGWGYRGSLHLMRRAAVVLRRGEGIRADLDGDRVFVVTVDDAATGAALLETYRQRQPA